jgi:hypothetical protein
MYNALKNDYILEYKGEFDIKGKGKMNIYILEDRHSDAKGKNSPYTQLMPVPSMTSTPTTLLESSNIIRRYGKF